MALTVENGTGLADADSYETLAAFKTYCANRGRDLTGKADNLLEEKLREATQYVDTVHRYKGEQKTSTQALEFPRTNCFDWSAREVVGVPKRVKDATCELAWAALTEGLYTNEARGGAIKSESVGPISVTYADDAPVGTVFRSADNLLKPYWRTDCEGINVSYAPVDETDMFAIGMMDNPGTTPGIAD